MKIDIPKLIFMYEVALFKPLSDTAHEGLTEVLHFIEDDEHITDIRRAAYMLATTYHETAITWEPTEEYGKGRGRAYGAKDEVTGHVYYGRGYVQLTWADNYRIMGKRLGVDLYHDPTLATIPEIAYKIMSVGMRNGMFTGVGLSKYIANEKCDYYNARRIINGTDCAEQIAGYARKFESMLKETATA